MALTGYEKNRLNDYTVSELISIAKNYYVTYKLPSGETSTNYGRLNKNQLISEIEKDRDYKSSTPTNLTIEESDIRPTDDSGNRIRRIVNKLIGIEDPDLLWNQISNILSSDTSDVPEMGELYTFTYVAKTPNIVYDLYPLIVVENYLQSQNGTVGFIGFNFHWNKYRKYTWEEVQTPLYKVRTGELADLREIPYAKFLNR